ncbi:MAG: hypothetical protein C0600_05785 [Ignavibacteria bacterium]|nr:MAG: hypothetical protein C0600_05785 [Ignavibacteria bacterium]
MQSTVFITGGTGLVGADIIRRLLRDAKVDSVIALVRGEEREARPRLLEAVRQLETCTLGARELEKLTVVSGDVTESYFGRSRQEWQRIARSVTHIIHSAADVRFNLSLAEARRVNLGGTRMMLDFAEESAEAGRLEHFAYVSTAYVCGERTGRISEETRERPPAFTNSYEQSKWECEREVRAAMTRFPATIFRPSIIVGDSRTGRTNAFKALYAPLRMILRGMLQALPDAKAPLDVVPVDYVSRVICHVLLAGRGEGRTLHLTAGAKRSCSVAEIAFRALHAAGVAVSPATAQSANAASVSNAAAQRTAQVLEAFSSYMSEERDFDDSNTRSAVAGAGIGVPALRDYLDTIVEFCLETNWGKRRLEAA